MVSFIKKLQNEKYYWVVNLKKQDSELDENGHCSIHTNEIRNS